MQQHMCGASSCAVPIVVFTFWWDKLVLQLWLLFGRAGMGLAGGIFGGGSNGAGTPPAAPMGGPFGGAPGTFGAPAAPAAAVRPNFPHAVSWILCCHMY